MSALKKVYYIICASPPDVKPNTDAPCVCLEPWISLPPREGIIKNLAFQSDLLFPDPGGVYRTKWRIEIN